MSHICTNCGQLRYDKDYCESCNYCEVCGDTWCWCGDDQITAPVSPISSPTTPVSSPTTPVSSPTPMSPVIQVDGINRLIYMIFRDTTSRH